MEYSCSGTEAARVHLRVAGVFHLALSFEE